MSTCLVAGSAGLGQGRFSATELLTGLRQLTAQSVDARSMLIGLFGVRSPGLLQILLHLGGCRALAIDFQQCPTQVCLVPFFGRLGGVPLLGNVLLETQSRILKRTLNFTPLLCRLFELTFQRRSDALFARQIEGWPRSWKNSPKSELSH